MARRPWVGAHGGYVLTTRATGEYTLHLAECGHLGRGGDPALNLTARPGRWASKRRPLIEWAVTETRKEPLFPHSCL